MLSKLKIKTLKSRAEKEIKLCQKNDELEKIRVKYLGRKGLLTSLIKELPLLPPPQKKELGSPLKPKQKRN
ncbi:MAG: hypothetical protein ACOX5S_01795 [Patescibacteria group bacterium]